MPIASEFELTFGCGHVGVIDLSALPVDRRAGRLAYLQDKGLCGDCFVATRAKRRELEQTQWVTARRKEEAALASQWEIGEGFAPLTGSARQVEFASRVRFKLMAQLYQWAVVDEHDPAGFERVEATARGVDAARWWLDQRSLVTEPADLMELLDAASLAHEGQTCENTA